MNEQVEPVSWVIMYCVKDDSHSLVRDTAVICEAENLTIGDKANFYYQGSTFEGVVLDIGDDHDEMKDRLGKFNAKKPKKDSSFHADRPRKCALKCKDGLKALAGVGSSKVKPKKGEGAGVIKKQQGAKLVKSKTPAVNKRKSSALDSSDDESDNAPLSKIKNASSSNIVGGKETTPEEPFLERTDDKYDSVVDEQKSGSASVGESDNSSDGEGLTADELKLLSKISAKKKITDFQTLMGLGAQKNNLLATKKNPVQVPSKLEKNVSEQKVKDDSSVRQVAEMQINAKPSSSKSSMKPSNDSDTSDDENPGNATADLSQQRKQVKTKFNQEMYQYTANSDNVEELIPDSDVYVSCEEIKKIRKKATSVTACARGVLRAVFTKKHVRNAL